MRLTKFLRDGALARAALFVQRCGGCMGMREAGLDRIAVLKAGRLMDGILLAEKAGHLSMAIRSRSCAGTRRAD